MDPTHAIIHLVDDDPSFLTATRRLLEISGFAVRTFSAAADFLQQHQPDVRGCVVLDLQMPGLSGLEVQAELARKQNPLPILFLTAYGDIPSSVSAMKGGAEDFLLKPVTKDALLAAVRRALAHDAAAQVARHQHGEWRQRYATLTPAERRVFRLIVRGLPNKGIAGEIGTCERTVKAHRAAVMRKMRVQSPAELGRAVEWLGEVFEKG